MVPYGTIWYHMVPYGTIWYHKVPRPGWGGTLLGREDILGVLTLEKTFFFTSENKKIVNTCHISRMLDMFASGKESP